MDKQDSVQRFLELIRRSHRGKFKIYIGMMAGVGKTYRMLQEAHELLNNGIDVRIGYVETHGRPGTEAMLRGLPVVPLRKLFYKGKELEEMDTQAIINLHPEIVIVDELAHTNIEGSGNPKRWQDADTRSGYQRYLGGEYPAHRGTERIRAGNYGRRDTGAYSRQRTGHGG